MHPLVSGINFFLHSVNLVLSILLPTFLITPCHFIFPSSPLSLSITSTVFHSRLKTYLFQKSLPPQTSDCLHRLRTAERFSSFSFYYYIPFSLLCVVDLTGFLPDFLSTLNIFDWLVFANWWFSSLCQVKWIWFLKTQKTLLLRCCPTCCWPWRVICHFRFIRCLCVSYSQTEVDLSVCWQYVNFCYKLMYVWLSDTIAHTWITH